MKATTLKQAVDRYTAALTRRVASKELSFKAEMEEAASRRELAGAKEELRTLEADVNENIIFDARTPIPVTDKTTKK